ncbi:unnamed protein product [Phaedon cochleariae]|uniref:Uncharacterized protein n=1 Tax=Phaedon cochleariae TaxID=80249 RepID=A0A9P0DQ38_PHACE|nr:unnamed protein product [Phaedon cochleariae]
MPSIMDSGNPADMVPEEIHLKYGHHMSHTAAGDKIVISGISGVFPSSRNVEEFRQNLYNKIDMITETHRPGFEHPDQPARHGTLPPILDYFDAGYFGLNMNEVDNSYVGTRMVLERVIEAIFDAGMNPKDLENSKTGIFTGVSNEESITKFYKPIAENDAKPMFLRRLKTLLGSNIAHHLRLKGPVVHCDTACSTTLHSLDSAYQAISQGRCDAAIVCGHNFCLAPGSTLQFAWLGVLSKEGMCQPFDKDGNGYVRSEAQAVIILQRARDAKRVYAEVVHCKTNSDGFKERGITFPNTKAQKLLMEEVCIESNVAPSSLSFLEAHGTGTPAGDPEECTAIDDVLTKNRDGPLLIGSVKSSIGHSEPLSGLCSTVKVILAMESNQISPNLHFKEPRPCPALTEGRLKVVTEVTELEAEQPVIGINSFGFGGSNGHILLRAIARKKVQSATDSIPRLLCVSGRSREAVETLLNEAVKKHDAEHIRLLQNVFRKDVPGHIFKGYTVISKDTELRRSIKRISLERLPLYLVFGEFKNWYTTLNELMELPVFQETIERIRIILVKNKIDIKSTILSKDPIIRKANNALGNFITSMCVAMVLKKLNTQVVAAKGDSTGVIVAAFYENKLNLDQALAHAGTLNGKSIYTKPQMDGIQDVLVENGNLLPKKGTIVSNGTEEILKKKQTIGSKSITLEIGESMKQKITTGESESLTVETVSDFLSLFGSLYEHGYTLPIEKLFPKVDFPVSRGTPMISSDIKWIHDRKWEFDDISKDTTGRRDKVFQIGLKNKQWSFISGHIIDGRILFPAAGYLYLAWQTLEKKGDHRVLKTLRFKNCRFIRATTINPTDDEVTLKVSILSSGYFEIMERDALVVTGEIYVTKDDPEESNAIYPVHHTYQNSKDIYKELRLRGYHYSGEFRSIEKVSDNNTDGLIRWNNNWITLIDNMFQMKILQVDTRLLYVPTYIAEVKLYLNFHDSYIKKLESERDPERTDDILLPVQYYPEMDQIRCIGVDVHGLAATSIKRRKYLGTPVLERYEFVPNHTSLSLPASVRVNAQIILENTLSNKVKSVEVVDSDTPKDSQLLTPLLLNVLEDEPLTHTEAKILCETPLDVDILVENKTLNQQSGNTLVIASRLLSRPEKLADALEAIKVDGYIISREPIDLPNCKLTENNILSLTTHRTSDETLVLIGKQTRKTKPVFINVTDIEDSLDWIDPTKIALSNEEETILYSHRNSQNGLIGFINCIRREPGGKNMRSMLVLDKDVDFNQSNNYFINQLEKNMAINVFKNGQWGTYRHLLLEDNGEDLSRDYCVVNQLVKGDISSLRWFDTKSKYVDAKSLLQIDSVDVHYAALNFRDVMLASGKLSGDDVIKSRLDQENVIGFEFSGKNSRGERVMGMVPSGALATKVTPDPTLLWKVPDNWSLSEAATIPVVSGTITYALSFRGKMRRGDSVLIHSGTGGIGQAAIRYALHHGCTVYTTVGNESKREFLKMVFPQLTDDHIGNSRDNSFERMVMKRTDGRGVDLVLNSLAEDKLITSVRCLARGGRFLEIGKYDIVANNALNLILLEKDASFHGVMLDQLFSSEPADKQILRKLVDDGIAEGSVKPLNMNIFKCNELEQAFRFMAGGKHMGKVLIEVRRQGLDKTRDNQIKPIPKYNCTPTATYVIVGGLGGFGLELADWLILRGARKIVFSSRNGIRTGYQRNRIRTWRNYGVTIKICTADVTKREGSLQLIQDAEKLGPVSALFNLAAILQDALFENQTKEMFRTSLAPKADATRYLDEMTRKLCPQMSDFVVFSSVSCGRGNTGQTNYGMGNSVMERICEQRKRDGYPALAIQWGAIGEVGLVADMQDNHLELEISGTLQQRLSSCMEVMDILLTQKEAAIVSSMVVAEKKSSTNTDNIAEAVASILGITDVKSVSSHSTLAELGMDSMTAIEIKQILERDFELFLSSKEIRNLTLDSLMKIQESRKEDSTDDSKTAQKQHRSTKDAVLDIENLYKDNLELESRLSAEETGPTVFMFPGVEGTSKVLRDLALNIDAHVLFYPYNFGTLLDTISDMANSHLEHIERKLKRGERFFFIAYSYGVSVALEVISTLESRGYTGILVVLDGSPTHSKELLRSFDNYSETEFGINILCGILDCPFSDTEIETLGKCDNIDEKVQKAIDIFSTKSDISNDILKNLCVGIANRAKAMREYTPTMSGIRSKVIVCKPTVETVKCPDDLGLTDLCGPVEILTFEGNHVSLLENLQLAEKVNSLL